MQQTVESPQGCTVAHLLWKRVLIVLGCNRTPAGEAAVLCPLLFLEPIVDLTGAMWKARRKSSPTRPPSVSPSAGVCVFQTSLVGDPTLTEQPYDVLCCRVPSTNSVHQTRPSSSANRATICDHLMSSFIPFNEGEPHNVLTSTLRPPIKTSMVAKEQPEENIFKFVRPI